MYYLPSKIHLNNSFYNRVNKLIPTAREFNVIKQLTAQTPKDHQVPHIISGFLY